MTNDRYDVFISYATKDTGDMIDEIVTQIRENYKNEKGKELKIFFCKDEESISRGQEWEKNIKDGIDQSDIFIALYGPVYFKSDNCKKELKMWKDKQQKRGRLNKDLLPIHFKWIEKDPGSSENPDIREAFSMQTDREPWISENGNLARESIKAYVEPLLDNIEKFLKDSKQRNDVFTNIPQRLNSTYYYGRDTEVHKIHNMLNKEELKIPVLCGEEGVGKTRAAYKYAQAYASEYPGGIYFIDCKERKDVSEALTKCIRNNSDVCEQLNIDSKKKNELEPDFIKCSFNTQIRSKGKALIILDHVDELAMIDKDKIDNCFPHGPNLHIIATSRKNNLRDDNAVPVPIDDFSQQDAIDFLSQKTNKDKDKDEESVQRIINVTGTNAGLLTSLCICMNVRGWSYAEMADRLAKEYQSDSDKEEVKKSLDNWARGGLEGDEKQVAQYAAVLKSQYIYKEWLQKVVETENMEKILGNLEKAGVIKILPDKKNTVSMDKDTADKYRKDLSQEKKHEIVSKFLSKISDRLNNKEIRETEELSAVVNNLRHWIELDNSDICSKCLDLAVSQQLYELIENYTPTSRSYKPLLDCVLNVLKKKNDPKREFNARIYLSRSCSNIGMKEDALKYCKQADKLAEQMAESDGKKVTPEMLIAKYELANSYFELKNYDEALELRSYICDKTTRRIFRIIRRAINPFGIRAMLALAISYSENCDYKGALRVREEAVESCNKLSQDPMFETEIKDLSILAKSSLAVSYSELGQYEDAFKLRKEVYETLKEIDPTSPKTIGAKSALAISYTEKGEYEEAKKLREEILELRKNKYGEDHTYTLRTKGRLANSLSALGYYEEAKKHREDVLKARQKLFVAGHNDILRAKSALANSYSELGDYKKAFELREEVYEARKEKDKEELSRDTIDAMSSLAVSYSELGKYDEALSYRKKVLEKREELLKDNDRNQNNLEMITAKWSLANSYSEKGDYIKAKETREEVVEEVKNKFGKKHPTVLICKSNLSDSYFDLGDFKEAEKLRINIFNQRNNKLGESHPDTLIAKRSLAKCDYRLGRYDKALKKYIDVWSKFKEKFGDKHPETLKTKMCIAECYSAQKNYENASELYNDVLEETQNKLGEEHPNTIYVMRGIAYNYFMNEKYEDALKLRKDILEKRRRILGEDHPETLKTRRRVADCYLKLKKYNEALKIYNEILDKTKEKLGEEHPCTEKVQRRIAKATKMLKG